VPDLVFIRKQKRPDGSGVWGAYKTGEDAFGVWLFTPRGSLYRGEKAGSTAYCKVGSPEGPGMPVMHLVPRAAWWIATFWAPAEVPWSLTFEVSTPPRLDGAVRSYVHLQLDVWVESMTGSVQLEDEDEFLAACAVGTISPRKRRRRDSRPMTSGRSSVDLGVSSGYSDSSCDHLRMPDRHRVLCASAATPVPAVIIEFRDRQVDTCMNRCPTGMGRDPRLRDPATS
jgi:hypothetical protein